MNADDVPYFALAQGRESVDSDPAGPFLLPDGLLSAIPGPPGQEALPLFTSRALAEEYAAALGRPFLIAVAFRSQLEFLACLQGLAADGVGWVYINRRADFTHDRRINLRELLDRLGGGAPGTTG